MLTTVNNQTMLSNKAYNFLKKVAQIYIPALSSAYFGLAAIWHLPASTEVVGSLAVVDTFLGVCLGLSSNSYTKSGAGVETSGDVIVSRTESGSTILSMELNDDPEKFLSQPRATFNVKPYVEDEVEADTAAFHNAAAEKGRRATKSRRTTKKNPGS